MPSGHARRLELPHPLRSDPAWAMGVVESLPIPLVIFKRSDGKVLFSNRGLEEILGWKIEKLLNRTYEVLFPRIPDRKRLRETFDRNGRVRGELLRAQRRGGDEVWVSVWEERTVCSGLECVILMFTDATQQKQREAEQAARCESLERVLDASERQCELIGYEIHDGFVQEMVTALMHLDAYRWAEGEQSERAAKELDSTTKALRDGVEEARRLIDRVQPPDLKMAGLVGAVRKLVNSTQSQKNIPIDFTTDLSFPKLSDELEVTVYRVVQECLNNIRRHSNASHAEVGLRNGAGRVEIEVSDDGVGFDPQSVEGDHYGLAGIRHRVRLFNGDVEIISSPGEGTRVIVSLPLDSQAKQPQGLS
jgi:PAS domain S-box-containing protein